MEFEADILKPFFESLVEMHRQDIMGQEDVKQMVRKQTELSMEVMEKIRRTYPGTDSLLSDYLNCIFDLNTIMQEELYIRGMRDGIKFMKMLKEI